MTGGIPIRDDADRVAAAARAREGSLGARSDAEIIRRSQAVGEVFAELYHRHSSAVYGYVARRMGPELTEDVAAETFLAAFRVRSRYDLTRADALPWLLGIATREISRRRRTERARYRMLARLAPEPPHEDPTARTEAAVMAQSIRGPLAQAIRALRPVERDVLLLTAWGDLSYAEVAEALDIPIGTVRSRLHRARQAVRAALPARADQEGEHA